MVQQENNGKKTGMPFSNAFAGAYAKSHNKLGSFLRHLLIGNYMDYDLDASEKENMRNKQELKEFCRTKVRELTCLREVKPINLERDYISYVDSMLADPGLAEDEDTIVMECLAAYQNLALPVTASIL